MDCLGVCYKKVGGVPIHLDVYYPPSLQSQPSVPRLPVVCYFHGGGLTVGNRNCWFPTWMKARMTAAGFVFISADYRLLPSATIHDIIDDIKDLFSFLHQDDLVFKTDQGIKFGIDATSIAVAGSSAGGICAYLAALYASPKPKAVLSMYGQGGNFLNAHHITPKSEVFFLGRELLDPENFSELLYPGCMSLPPISDSPLAYHPASSPTPGWPANPRMPLPRLLLQLGVPIDYYTGEYDPSLSAQLRPLLADPALAADPTALQAAMQALIPPRHHAIFPQLNITPRFPPTFLCHGSVDTAVLPAESEHMCKQLERAGVSVRLLVVEGADHSFDYAKDAEARYAVHFDEMAEFLKTAKV
ncbi:alpha/beta-hydrolase [Mycena galericulata]|nr:alpha/beta-hydrolase [Mycena galericulata]